MLRLLLISLLFAVLSFPALAQGEEKPVTVPDAAMQQVVRRVVTWYFKPRTKPKTIYFSNQGIKADWLPNIRNINFVLVEPDSPESHERGVYFFKDVRIESREYLVDFGFGDPGCRARGDTWSFRVVRSRLRLYQINGGFGSLCSAGIHNPLPTTMSASVRGSSISK